MKSQKIDKIKNNPEEPEDNKTWGIKIVSLLTLIYAALIVLNVVLPGVDRYGNLVYKRALLPIIVGMILIGTGVSIHKGKNWARWTLCVMVLIVSLLSFSWLFGFYVNVDSIALVVSLVLFLPFLFTRKARLYFKENSGTVGKK